VPLSWLGRRAQLVGLSSSVQSKAEEIARQPSQQATSLLTLHLCTHVLAVLFIGNHSGTAVVLARPSDSLMLLDGGSHTGEEGFQQTQPEPLHLQSRKTYSSPRHNCSYL
jgi:hypothetical protein